MSFLSDIQASFDVVSLFIMVHVTETLDLLNVNISKNITALFQYVLTTFHVKWDSQFHEQLDRRVAKRNLVGPNIANY